MRAKSHVRADVNVKKLKLILIRANISTTFTSIIVCGIKRSGLIGLIFVRTTHKFQFFMIKTKSCREFFFNFLELMNVFPS